MLYVISKLLCAVCTHFHFTKLNSCFFLDRFCKCSLSPPVLTRLCHSQMSVTFHTVVQDIDIFIKNNKCPNTDPCGTPLKTDFQFETSQSTTKHLMYVSHCSIQSIVPSLIPWAFNLSSNLSCRALSKAYWKSK